MSNDPWGPAPTSPPPSVPSSGSPDYYARFTQQADRPNPPGLALTIVVTLFAGVFGTIPATLHSARARQLGLDGGRYWKAFGITFGAVVASQLLIVGGLFATGMLGANLFTPAGSASENPAELPPASATTPEEAPPTVTEPLEPSPIPSPQERTGRDEPDRSPTSVSIVTESSGDPCTVTSGLSGWGGYPVARCRTWKPSTGLLTGAPLSTGPKAITCQADLQEQNPVYTAGQSNTWWVWTQADDGSWDWFPETALAEGASDQPINGIARCQ